MRQSEQGPALLPQRRIAQRRERGGGLLQGWQSQEASERKTAREARGTSRAACGAKRYLEAGCGTVLSMAPEGCPPVEPLGAAGVDCAAPLGEPTPVWPTTPVGAAPGDVVPAPAGTLFDGSGAFWLALGEGGDCVAPDWASAGPAISPAVSTVAAKAVRTALCKIETPSVHVGHSGRLTVCAASESF